MKKYILFNLLFLCLIVLNSNITFAESNLAKPNLNDRSINHEQKYEKIKTNIEKIRQERELERLEREKIKKEVDEARFLFKKQIETKKEEMKGKSIAYREELKNKLKVVKDERKQNLVLNIYDNIEKLNIKATDRLANLLTKIEDIHNKVIERTDKANEDGLSTPNVYKLIDVARTKITDARTAIAIQIVNKYKVEVTTENLIKDTMKNIRDEFHADIKDTQDKVKEAHEAVRESIKALNAIVTDNNTNNNAENEVVNDNTEEFREIKTTAN